MNIRPSEFFSYVLGAWDTSVNKTKILTLRELAFSQREIVNNKHNRDLR